MNMKASTFAALFTAASIYSGSAMSEEWSQPKRDSAANKNHVLLVSQKPSTTLVETSVRYEIEVSKKDCSNEMPIAAHTTLKLFEIDDADIQILELQGRALSKNLEILKLTSL